MRLNCLDAHAEDDRRFLVGVAFGDQLNDFALTRRHDVLDRLIVVGIRSADITVQNELGNLWCQKRLVPAEAANGGDQTLIGFDFKTYPRAPARSTSRANSSV